MYALWLLSFGSAKNLLIGSIHIKYAGPSLPAVTNCHEVLCMLLLICT